MVFDLLKSLIGQKNTIDTSSWNEIGRDIARFNAQELAAFHEGRKEFPDLKEDTRSVEMAQSVLAQVVALNKEGRQAEARSLFDPTLTPFAPMMEESERGLGFCAILGADEFLVQQGTYYQDMSTWRIKGDEVSRVPTLSAFSWSRNRQWFLSVSQDGEIALSRTYGAQPSEVIPPLPGAAFFPAGLPDDLLDAYETLGENHQYTHVSVSDDGQKVLLADPERGVVLVFKHQGRWRTQPIYPAMSLGLEDQMREFLQEDEEFRVDLDMLHATLSPDGRFVAFGTQYYGHYLIDVSAPDKPVQYAHLGHLSEYPHDACFDDRSEVVALNSCHFYNGVTFSSLVSKVAGLETAPWGEHPTQTIINTYLRVYASGFVPASAGGVDGGGFLLAGSGFANCVSPAGKVRWELETGSSAGGVDICPETGLALVSSYSGMLHLLDLSRRQEPVISTGYNAPHELRRWVFWDQLEQPIAW